MTVNEFGLGEPNGLGRRVMDEDNIDPLATGLGSPDELETPDDDEPGTEFGLGDAESQPNPPVGEEPQPPKHGLGS